MSIALNPRPASPATRSYRTLVSWLAVGVILFTLGGYVALDLLSPSRLHASQGQGKGAASAAQATAERSHSEEGPASSVSLSETKFREAKIAIEPARIDRLGTEVGVPGMIQSNADRRVEIRPRAVGVVRSVHAVIGAKVKKGDILVVLDSPEVGKARLDLRARQRELANAQYDARWKGEIADNVQALIPALEKGIAEDIASRHQPTAGDRHDEEAMHRGGAPARAEAMELQFTGKNLGAYRGTLLQAFADYEIAVHEEVKNISLQRQDIFGEHMVVVARHTREGVQQKLKGIIEQVKYDSAQERRMAVQALKQAEASLVDAAQRLRILDVEVDIRRLLEHPEEGTATDAIEDVTRYDITAPIDGNIVKKFAFAARGQKADSNDVLFVLSDLSTVWVKADVSESDLAKLSRLQGGTFRFRAARAYPGREFTGRLISVGSVVDLQTRTVPILAEAANPEGLLKADMFAQIILDSSAVEEVLTVPSAAIVEIEGDRFVFVPTGKPRTYMIRPVEAGRRDGDRTVIRAGLTAEEKVVSSGAFFLKSELTFHNEPPEE
jgi:membrane fusion protein, heavy metal efflux system